MVHTPVKGQVLAAPGVLLECYMSCRINANCQPCLEICFILNSDPVKVALWLLRMLLPLMWKNVSFCGLDLCDRQFQTRAQDFWKNFCPSYDHQAFVLDRRVSYHCWMNSQKRAAIHCKVWDTWLSHQVCFTEGLRAHTCLLEWQSLWWLKQCPCGVVWIIAVEAPQQSWVEQRSWREFV